MKHLPLLVLPIALLPACSREESEPARVAKARNLLLITVDTLRADHVGCYGGREGVTPIIDALAQEGALFEEAHAPMGMTLACMTSMFTSKYPDETGVTNNMQKLSPDEYTLAERLRAAGFRTRGFTANGVLQPGKSDIEQGFDAHRRIQSEGQLTAEAAQILIHDFGNVDGTRDFLWLHYMDPHQPYDRREPYATEFDPDYDGPFDAAEETLQRIFIERIDISPRDLEHIAAVYDSQVRMIDIYVRSILSALAQSGKSDETLVVFTADHGEDLYDHNHYFYHANSIYRSVTHVPLIFRQKGAIPSNVRVPGLVEHVDVMPTILSHLGLDPTEGTSATRPRGVDLGPSMHGEPLQKTFVFSQVFAQIYGVRSREWLYVRNPDGFIPRSIPEEGEYLISAIELYALRDDGREQTNVAARHPALVAKLDRVLEQWRERLVIGASEEFDMTDEELREFEELGYVGSRKPKPPPR